MDNQTPELQPTTPQPQQPSPSSVPPPPRGPEIKIRTMESDIKSIEQSGGGIPEAETIRPEELGSGAPVGEINPPVPPIRQFSPIAMAPEEPITEIKEQSVSNLPDGRQGKTRKWLIWLLVLSILIAVGVAVYVYLMPLLFISSPILIPGQIINNTQEPIIPITAPIIPIGRQSIFGLLEEQVIGVEIGGYSVVNILTALQNEAALMSVDQPFKELTLTIGGLPANFSQFLTTLLPELVNTQVAANLSNDFEEKFTGFLIYQEGKVWPGYVVKKKNPQATITKLTDIEKSSISNIYLTLPSGQTSFSTGPVGDKYTSRYASFSNKPASFNYGIFGDYLIISTTFQGLTRVIELLGL